MVKQSRSPAGPAHRPCNVGCGSCGRIVGAGAAAAAAAQVHEVISTRLIHWPIFPESHYPLWKEELDVYRRTAKLLEIMCNLLTPELLTCYTPLRTNARAVSTGMEHSVTWRFVNFDRHIDYRESWNILISKVVCRNNSIVGRIACGRTDKSDTNCIWSPIKLFLYVMAHKWIELKSWDILLCR